MNDEFYQHSGTPSQEERDDIVSRGDEIFERLREQVWAEHEGEHIAIHVDTGEYAIARHASDASRALRAGREPDGRLYVRNLTDDPDRAPYYRMTGSFDALHNVSVEERKRKSGQE